MPDVKLVILVDKDKRRAIDTVADRLSTAGLKVERKMSVTGVICGTAPAECLDALKKVEGVAQVRPKPGEKWQKVNKDDQLEPGATVRTGRKSFVALRVGINATILIERQSRVTIPEIVQKGGTRRRIPPEDALTRVDEVLGHRLRQRETRPHMLDCGLQQHGPRKRAVAAGGDGR